MKLNKNTSPATTISSLPAPQPQSVHLLDGIFIRHNDYYRKFLYKDLLWLKAGGSYCDLHFRDDSRLTVSFCRSSVLSKLPAELFCRIHQSYAVNLCAIDKFYGNTVFIGETLLPVSRSHRPGFLSRLDILGNVPTNEHSDNNNE